MTEIYYHVHYDVTEDSNKNNNTSHRNIKAVELLSLRIYIL